MQIDLAGIVASARAGYESFENAVRGVSYERKGILFSEMFFFSLCAATAKPRRILESGRARGQSTLLLALCFPETEIVSVEHDPHSPDVKVAAERLRGRDNVRLLFGDATRMLPDLARSGDVALIDGPKGHRGLRLAIRLLASGNVPLVFLHDAAPGAVERTFLERHCPQALYSDAAPFAEVAHPLDRSCEDDIPPGHRWRPGAPAAGYGFSLACVPRPPAGNYRRLMASAALDGLAHRWFRRAATHG